MAIVAGDLRVVDNDSWILEHAEALVGACVTSGDEALLCRDHGDVLVGAVPLHVGCVKITPEEVLDRDHRNLVVQASALPTGCGDSFHLTLSELAAWTAYALEA